MQCLGDDTLIALLDGSLDEADRAEVHRHLDLCDECRGVVAALVAENPDAQPRSVPPPPREISVGSVLGGRFRLEELAGSGGMGRVYRARDLESGAEVAVKHLVGAGAHDERFRREVSSISGLAHPSIVRYVADGACEDGSPYLVMEWLAGEDLGARLARGPLSASDTVLLAEQLAGALGAAHERGIIHRDVKPSNVILRGGDIARAVLVDFGLARQTTASVRTRTGTLLGTPGYMAPEQVRGETKIETSADVFSLGCVLYECLTGVRAFAGTHLLAVLAKILTAKELHPRALAPEVPRALDALIARMLARKPAHRPADGRAVLSELAALTSWRGQARRALPRAAFAIAAAIGILGAVTAGALAWQRRHATRSGPGAPAGPVVMHPMTDFPVASPVPEAAAAYAEGLQAIRDASIGKALESWQRSLRLDPTMAAAHLRLSLWTDTAIGFAESRSHYHAARAGMAALSPRDRELLEAVEPNFLSEPPDDAETTRRSRALAARHPGDAELAYFALGPIGTEVGPEAFDEVLRIDPKFAIAWSGRANLQFHLHDVAGARASIDRCLAASPGASLCVLLRIRIEARDGACDDLERDARLLVAQENGGEYGNRYLANALTAREQDPAAVEAALQASATSTPDETKRSRTLLRDRAELAVAIGDFTGAEALARELGRAVGTQDFLEEHVRWATLLVDVLDERGDVAAAGKVADDFLRRRAGWRSIARRPFDDPLPTLLAHAVRARLRRPTELDRERTAYLASWQQKLGPTAKAELWLHGWARPAQTTAELAAAAGAMPPEVGEETIERGAVGWLTTGHPQSAGGRVQLAAGHPRAAVATLSAVTRNCLVLYDATAHRRSFLWLGQAYEALGDTARACESYASLLRHWGHARPRSVSAAAAAARSRALHCAGP